MIFDPVDALPPVIHDAGVVLLAHDLQWKDYTLQRQVTLVLDAGPNAASTSPGVGFCSEAW